MSWLDLSYYLFLASVPLEVLGTFYFHLGVSLSVPTGLLFVSFFFFSRTNSKAIRWPWPMLLPGSWILVILLHYMTESDLMYVGSLLGVANNLLFSVILYSYLTDRDKIRPGLAVMGLTTALTGVAILVLDGFGIFSGGRFSILNFDENNLGSILGLGALILVLLSLSQRVSFRRGVVYVGLTVPTLAIVVATGSRGAMLAFALSILLSIMVFLSRKISWLRIFLVFLVIGTATTYFYQHSPLSQQRWQATIAGKTTAYSSREILFRNALQMFWDRPLFGWGIKPAFQELGHDLRGYGAAGTHNTFLMIATTSGLAGSLPFLVFFLHPFFLLRKQKENELFKILLVLLVFVLMVFMSLDWLNRKQLWIIYTMLIATAYRGEDHLNALPK